MISHRSYLVFVTAFCLFFLTSSAYAKKSDYDTWKLNIQFTVGVKDYTGVDKTNLDKWVLKQIIRAEKLFSTKPKLKIKKTIVRKTKVGGRSLATLKFDTVSEYAKFMDQNFDTMANSKTDGYFQVLIVNEICVGFDKDRKAGTKSRHCTIRGRATFPHWIDPLTRKHGIIMVYPDSRDFILAHELGHFLSLKHTFDPYSNVDPSLLCNKAYEPKIGHPEAGQCKSCITGTVDYVNDTCTGKANVMDYCKGPNDLVYLNSCQQRRARNQRKTYMTKNGETNYYKMKGKLGAAACTKDADCGTGKYCNKGVSGIGRNQCVNKLADWKGCTSGHQCKSGKCKSGLCYTANSIAFGKQCYFTDECKNGKCSSGPAGIPIGKCVCEADADCGSKEYCNKGVAGIGSNVCKAKLSKGKACTKGHQCLSGKCPFLKCS